MVKSIIAFCFALSCLNVFGQNSYYTIPIQHDTAIQWAAECDKVVNLSPKIKEFSLKKWYLDKLKNGSVTAYLKNSDNSSVSSYTFSLPGIQTQDWLTGLGIEVWANYHPAVWTFIDKTLPRPDYERVKYRSGTLNFSADSCCGCDDADAFRAKQVLTYKNGKFSIHNVFISPLCLRQTKTPPADWFPLCNVAYNDNMERKFPGLCKDVVLLNTDEVDYDFNLRTPSAFDSVLTVYRTDIGGLIYQDILKGRLKPVEIETGKIIPTKKFLTWRMPADTIPVYDVNDVSKIVRYQVVQAERSSREFSRIRIKQELYFDFKNEKLYSVVRSVTLMQVYYLPDGSTVRGVAPFCRLE